jgi:hypothetical protein
MMARKPMTEIPKQHQYVIEQAAVRRITDIAKELGVSRQRIDQILKKHGIRLNDDRERADRLRKPRVKKYVQRDRKRPWFYPIIRKLARQVNKEGITEVGKRHGLNTETLREAFVAAGFDVHGGQRKFMKVYFPENKTQVELDMEKGLGPHLHGKDSKRYNYDPNRRKKHE